MEKRRMWYNLPCRDVQNTGALSFSEAAVFSQFSIAGKAPSKYGHSSLAVRLDNGGIPGGRFAMSYLIHRRLTRSKKDAILERDAYTCIYCGEEATVVDHIIPWDWMHNDDPINLVAACQDCNLMASDKVFDCLADKAAYIRARRNLPKWIRRRKERKSVNICVSCGGYFKLCANGATNFLCPRCAKEADLEPKERERRKAEREEQKRQYLLQNPPIDY